MLKPWTILLYMAGDNNLEREGLEDLAEIKTVGSGDGLNVVAQFDRMGDGGTRRYALSRDRPLGRDCVATLPETNTGDPAALLDFVRWGLAEFPAEHTALVLWNHGAGWKDDDIYALAREVGLSDTDLPRSATRGLGERTIGGALFSTTVQRLLQYPPPVRGILFDDTSRDLLDNQELASVLSQVLAFRNGNKLDLIGFDACLMNMVEVAAQVGTACAYMVGSQEVEPSAGWPYHLILRALADQPDMDAAELSAAIVDQFVACYSVARVPMPVTQAAIRLENTPALVAAIDALARGLIDAADDRFWERTLLPAVRGVSKFRDWEYVDLMHLAQLLGAAGRDDTASAAQRVVEELARRSPDSIVIKHQGSRGERLAANGLSIYLPLVGRVSPAYDRLKFAAHSAWGRFLERFASA